MLSVKVKKSLNQKCCFNIQKDMSIFALSFVLLSGYLNILYVLLFDKVNVKDMIDFFFLNYSQ